MAVVRRQSKLGKVLFTIIVVFPTIFVSIYYTLFSSDQYISDLRFSVRGTETSPLDAFGLGGLPGADTQSADAYIVIDYIKSKQIIVDINEKLNLDVRKKYSKSDIDFIIPNNIRFVT